MSLLPPHYLDAVVAIGTEPNNWIGTGFLYGDYLRKNTNGQNEYMVWLITNKHVLNNLNSVLIKFNSAISTDSKNYQINLFSRNGRPQWIGHSNPDVDVAAIFINANLLNTDQRKFSIILSDSQTLDKNGMIENQITEGDRIFVLGFPMGIVDQNRQYVFCRTGCYARVRDYIEGLSNDYIVDATVFPGNSGGPVFSCPSALSIEGTKAYNKSSLIGIVKAYIPYRDLAISSQTGKPRITFEENSGLTAVESMDSIKETVKLAKRRIRIRASQLKYRNKI